MPMEVVTTIGAGAVRRADAGAGDTTGLDPGVVVREVAAARLAVWGVVVDGVVAPRAEEVEVASPSLGMSSSQ